MDVWMKRELQRPPDYTLAYTVKERRSNVCVQALLEGVLRGHALLFDKEVSGCFKREAAILTASLFQNGRHRTEKFYKALKKVKKSSERWMELNLSKILVTLSRLMPAVPLPHRTIRMPSKQMFQYLLIRVLGGFHLLLSLDRYCRESAGYLMFKISSGHFFCAAMAFLSNVARLRALALDLCGLLSKLYDDIFPWISKLKGANVPELVLQESLPQSLSDYLQQYSKSLRVKSFKDVRRDLQFSKILNMLMEDEDTVPCQSGGPSGYNRSLEGAAAPGISSCWSKTSSTEEHQLDSRPAAPGISSYWSKTSSTEEHQVDSRPAALGVSFEEDIGVSVNVKGKFSGHVIDVNNGSNKWKGSLKTRKEKVSENFKRTKPSSDLIKNPKKAKRKEVEKADTLHNGKKKNTRVNHQCNTDVSAKSVITPEFLKHYQRVNKTVKKVDSVEALHSFLRLEKKRWFKKDCDRVSCLLKKVDWNMLKKLILTRLKKAKNLNGVLPLHQNIEQEQLIRKTKTRIKFWLLYPHLKGKKPSDWEDILHAIKIKKKNKGKKLINQI
ncbi:uncharacterized protein [Panulirus ornatus]|uniref:uncharacterized protein isoform X2 n=1 Tax=Panulirus ornatus TaxID=150431 RepID=UPI003A8C084B